MAELIDSLHEIPMIQYVFKRAEHFVGSVQSLHVLDGHFVLYVDHQLRRNFFVHHPAPMPRCAPLPIARESPFHVQQFQRCQPWSDEVAAHSLKNCITEGVIRS